MDRHWRVMDLQVRMLVLGLVMLVAHTANGQRAFPLPADRGGTPPVIYLERMEVKDSTRQLSGKERRELCGLFVEAGVITAREYPERRILNTKAPIYRLFKSNFPDVAAKEGPGGISLNTLIRYINSLPEYRSDVENLLRKSLNECHGCGQ